MDFAFTSLILLMNIEGFLTFENLHVSCERKNICALSDTEVTLRCSYESMSIESGFWFGLKQSQRWRHKDEPEDLSSDLEFSGRVDQRITERQSDLTIRDVKERDSGEYQLMFLMKDGVKHISSVSVNLTVTVLRVRIQQTEQTNLRALTCEASCTLTSSPQSVYWTKNGQYLSNTLPESLIVSSHANASYACLPSADFKISSDPVCLSDRCWDVTYPSRRVCALVGSTVDVQSSYSHPNGYTVVNTYWHLPNFKFIDLREEQRFAGRVEYVKNMLRIKDVKMSDSGEYQFRIVTEQENYSGLIGVILTVTDTEVIRSPYVGSDGEEVMLSCSTKCTLNKNTKFLWLKNGRPASDGFKLFNKLYLNSVSNDELKQYSCIVEDPAQGSDKNLQTYIIVLVLCLSLLLILAVTGILMYRFSRRGKSSNNHDDRKAATQSTVSYSNQTDLLHYSSLSFKHPDKATASTSSAIDSSTEEVQYATVKLS